MDVSQPTRWRPVADDPDGDAITHHQRGLGCYHVRRQASIGAVIAT